MQNILVRVDHCRSCQQNQDASIVIMCENCAIHCGKPHEILTKAEQDFVLQETRWTNVFIGKIVEGDYDLDIPFLLHKHQEKLKENENKEKEELKRLLIKYGLPKE